MRKLIVSLIVLTLLVAGGWLGSRSRTWQAFGTIVSRVEAREKLVALTFDDGPVPGATEEILAHLRKAGVRATFFLTGAEMSAHPELARTIAEAGHEIGNHSWSHRRMLLRSPSDLEKEIADTDAAIRAAGYEGPVHLRAPYGKKGLVLPWLLARDRRTMVTWDVEPDSYADVASSPERIVAHVRERVRPGSIVLLHVMYASRRTSMDAVPALLRTLQADGYRFVTVDELLGSPRRRSTARYRAPGSIRSISAK